MPISFVLYADYDLDDAVQLACERDGIVETGLADANPCATANVIDCMAVR